MTSITEGKIKTLCSLTGGAAETRVVTHHNPDGDAVGSTVAMTHFLNERCGTHAVAVYPCAIPPTLAFMTEGEEYEVFEDNPEEVSRDILGCDLLICLDFNVFSRTNAMEDVLKRAECPKVLIDHHLNPDTESFDLVFSETAVSSACELLYRVLMAMPQTGGDASALPAPSAKALMTGMTTDTNNFANSVYPGTLSMASDLLAAGVDRDNIIQNLYNSYRINRVQIFSHMLGSQLRTTEYGAAYMILTKDIWERFGCMEGETEGLVNVPLSIGDVSLSLLLREDDGFFRVSLRSKEGVSAARLAAEFFHGGGHEKASGGRLFFPGDIASAGEAAAYVEKVTAQFMQEQSPAKHK